MKPESRSRTLLSITRSKAKMYEYNVPAEYHIAISRDPARLFNLTIGLLGDLAGQTNSGSSNPESISSLKDSLRFSAYFFDAYLQSRLQQEFDPYLTLLGSASYYLCDLPGSSRVLAGRVSDTSLDLQCSGLERLLLWLLKGDLVPYSDGSADLFQESTTAISNCLLRFCQAGQGMDELFESLQRLRRKAYDSGTPRQLLFADVICAVAKKRLEDSAWHSLPLYSGIPVEEWSGTLAKDTFMKELWPAQHLLGEKGVYRGRSAVVQMPTSAGKTRATEIVIRSAFLAGRTSLAVIVAPFRALCHEISNSLRASLRGEDVSVNELTDVFQSDFDIRELLTQRQVLVVTPEKLVYVLRHSPEIAQHMGLLVYDEGHQFDNGARGITYELLVAALKSMVPKGIQTLLVSAVITNAESIGKWLNGDDFELVYGTALAPTYRTVAFASWKDELGRLEFVSPDNPEIGELFVPRVIHGQRLNLKPRERLERTFPDRNDGQTVALFLGLKLAANGAVAVFCGKKGSAGKLCEKLVDACDRGLTLTTPIEFANRDEIKRLAHLYARNLGDDAAVTQCARLGVLTHHGNTPHGIRLAVEHAVRNRRVRFVICTSTLAQGVNLPIRYLIVGSVYQGAEPIRVRDFHNLIGRAGRADQHTEGSIIFADPKIYDERDTYDGKRRWRQIKTLLDPGKSETCASNLLEISDPLYSDDRRYQVAVDATKIVSAYVANRLDELLRAILAKYPDKGFTDDGLRSQMAWKVDIIAAVENYLMAHWDESKSALENEDIINLASETLGYFLADEEQKRQLLEVFTMLEKNIEQNVPEAAKRMIYGRSLYGVRTSLSIDAWISQNIEELMACDNQDELLSTIWPVLAANIHNGTFEKWDPPEVRLDIALGWIRGQTYAELLRDVCQRDARIIAGSKRWNVKLDHVIDICDNGLSYDGTLVISAIAELIGVIRPEDGGKTVIKLSKLQKSLKYGLPTAISIALYEQGFADRVVSADLAAALPGNTSPDRRSIARAIRRNEEKVGRVLVKHPSYFTEMLDNLVKYGA